MKIALFFHLGGDIDILTPFLARRADFPESVFRLIVAEPLQRASRRLTLTLEHFGAAPDFVLEQEAGPEALQAALESVDALVTASETTLRPHRLAHALTLAANAARIATYTLQHGIENVGLTWFDVRQGPEVRFASSKVFTWQDPAFLPLIVAEETRNKCVGVGYAPPPLAPYEHAAKKALSSFTGHTLVGVLENLHWTRYSDDYRIRFLSDLSTACAAFPDVTFLMKPHPEGRWLTQRFQGDRPQQPNLVIADPVDPVWSLLTAPALAPHLAAMITTPSKTALDAAIEHVPVAVSAYEGAAGPYQALPALARAPDWIDFVDQALSSPEVFATGRRAFLDTIVTPGDALAAILGQIAGSG